MSTHSDLLCIILERRGRCTSSRPLYV